MKKCVSCIWLSKVNERVSYCPFIKCAKEKLENEKTRGGKPQFVNKE